MKLPDGINKIDLICSQLAMIADVLQDQLALQSARSPTPEPVPAVQALFKRKYDQWIEQVAGAEDWEIQELIHEAHTLHVLDLLRWKPYLGD